MPPIDNETLTVSYTNAVRLRDDILGRRDELEELIDNLAAEHAGLEAHQRVLHTAIDLIEKEMMERGIVPPAVNPSEM